MINWKQRLFVCTVVLLSGIYLAETVHPYAYGITGFILGKVGAYPLLKWIYNKLGD